MKATCRNSVQVDKAGRVRAVLENRPGKLTLEAPIERTKGDYARSNKDIADMLLQHFEGKRKARHEARERKKGASASTAMTAHNAPPCPLGPGVEMLTSDDEADGEEDDFLTCMENMKGQIKVSALINNAVCSMMVDTGASKSLCSTDAARLCGLRNTGRSINFVGIGQARAEEQAAVAVKIANKTLAIRFFAVDGLAVEWLLGLDDLRKFKLNIDICNHCVVPYSIELALPTSGCSPFENEITHQNMNRTIDHVSGVREDLSDKELLARARKTFEEMTLHLESTPEVRQELWELLEEFRVCWLRPRSGGLKGFEASFTVRGPPILQKLRYLPPEHRELLEVTLKQMLDKGVVRPSKSAWGSCPVFVRKKDGGWRICLDYRRVNARMEPDGYPLPLLWPNLQMASGHAYYVCLDCNWGFWNVRLSESAKQYTALITHKGTFEFNVLPFGIRNSPGEFQRAIDQVLGDLYGSGVLCYVDDIVVYANSTSELLKLLRAVLIRCRESGLYLKLAKSEFVKTEVRLLGHVVGLWGILPDPRKVEAVVRARAPKNISELRSFLGLASYLRRFVPDFASVAAPLIELTSPKRQYVWSDECEVAFQTLKELICEDVILSAPVDGAPFALMTDASDVGIGAVLLQYVPEEGPRVLELASHKFTDAEKR